MDNYPNAVKIASDPNQIKLLNRDERKEMAELRTLLRSMTTLEIRFVEAYIKTASAGQAAKIAGSTSKTPETIGYKMLQKLSVQKAIAIAMKKRIEAVGLDSIEVIQKLREVYEASMLAKNFQAANRACELLLKELERVAILKGEGSVKRASENNSLNPSGEDSNSEDVTKLLGILSKSSTSAETVN